MATTVAQKISGCFLYAGHDLRNAQPTAPQPPEPMSAKEKLKIRWLSKEPYGTASSEKIILVTYYT
jgi:hypothetical protein